jgi:hypothetical protein
VFVRPALVVAVVQLAQQQLGDFLIGVYVQRSNWLNLRLVKQYYKDI